jgi:hypothetical protein
MNISITFIADWLKAFRIWRLKQRIRKYYKLFYTVLDDYSCGANIALEISPRLRLIRDAFNWHMDRLATLDPNTPKTRL